MVTKKVVASVCIFISLTLGLKAQEIYWLNVQDLKDQFSKKSDYNMVCCRNSAGSKVYVDREGLVLSLTIKGQKTACRFMAERTECLGDAISGSELTLFGQKKSVNLDDISKIELTGRTRFICNFSQKDSLEKIVDLKNDSIKHNYNLNSKYVIYWRSKSKIVSYKDSVMIMEKACYHFVFADNKEVYYGIVMKITPDSVFVSSAFSGANAKKEGVEYKILKYKISDIKILKLPRNSGFGYKKLYAKDYELDVIAFKHSYTHIMWDFYSGCPEFYSIILWNWELVYSVNLLTERGFVPIREDNGRIYW